MPATAKVPSGTAPPAAAFKPDASMLNKLVENAVPQSTVGKAVVQICHVVINAPSDAISTTFNKDKNSRDPGTEGRVYSMCLHDAATALGLTLTLTEGGDSTMLTVAIPQPPPPKEGGGDKKKQAPPVTFSTKKPAAVQLANDWYYMGKGKVLYILGLGSSALGGRPIAVCPSLSLAACSSNDGFTQMLCITKQIAVLTSML